MSEEREIPRGWATVKLSNVCYKITDGSHFSPRSVDIGFPYVTVKDLKNDTIDFSRCLNISKKDYNNLLNNDCNPLRNDVLFSKDGTVGKVALINYDSQFVVLSSLAILRPHPKAILSEYLFYILKSSQFLLQALNQKKGVAIRRIILRDLKEIGLNLPPLPEQHRIVAKIEELFSRLDKGVESLKTAQQQLKVYRQAVLKWAFEGKLTNKNVVDGELPEGWKWVQLGEVCTNVEYGSAAKSKEVGRVPVLRMGNIQGGKFDWGDLVYTDDEVEINKYLLKKNDVLFNRTNSSEWVGKTAIYKGERPAIFAGYLIRVNRIEALVDASYLTYYLNSHAAREYGNSVKTFGVNQANINGTKLKTYPVPLPLLSEQVAIVAEIESRLSVCDKIEESIEQSLKQAEFLRQSILKKAFEGKLFPQDPSDEPASILLARIKAERENKLNSSPLRGEGGVRVKNR